MELLLLVAECMVLWVHYPKISQPQVTSKGAMTGLVGCQTKATGVSWTGADGGWE